MKLLPLLILIALVSCRQNKEEAPIPYGYYIPIQFSKGWERVDSFSAITFFIDDSVGGISTGVTLHRDGRIEIYDTINTIKQMLKRINKLYTEKSDLMLELNILRNAVKEQTSSGDYYKWISDYSWGYFPPSFDSVTGVVTVKVYDVGLPTFASGTTIACAWSNCKCKVKL
jgi:hypothetical protein